MFVHIQVKDIEEARQIRLGLSDPAVKAFVCVMGTLSTLSSKRAKQRVLAFVNDHFDEKNARP